MTLALLLAAAVVTCGSGSELERSTGFHGEAGDLVAIVSPYATDAFALGRRDYKPALQFSEAYVAALGTTYVIKHFVHRCRQDGSNAKSFPSGHTTGVFSSAVFLQRQYGWRVGVPSLAVASYVGFTRVKTKRHHLTDVLAGAAIGTATSFLFVHPIESYAIQTKTMPPSAARR